MYRDHVQRRVILLWRSGGISLEVVACGFPLTLLLLQKRHGLDRRLLMLEACVELHDHIVTIRGTWHCLRVLCLLELAGQHCAQRRAGTVQQRDPRLFCDGSLKVGGSLTPTSGVLACIHMTQPGLSRCRGTFFAGILGMDSVTPDREAEHQYTQSARGFHRSFLPSDGFPPHSSHRTMSPTAMTPSSRTSANTPPAQSADIAFCKPGHVSSIRSQGLVSPRMRMRHVPIPRTRLRLLTRRIPLSNMLARRIEGDR